RSTSLVTRTSCLRPTKSLVKEGLLAAMHAASVPGRPERRAPPPHRPRVARRVVLYAGVCGPSLAVFVHREPFADPHAVRNGRPSALVRPCRSQAAGIRLRKGKRAASRTDAALVLPRSLKSYDAASPGCRAPVRP